VIVGLVADEDEDVDLDVGESANLILLIISNLDSGDLIFD
jgi:hypothetical protein